MQCQEVEELIHRWYELMRTRTFAGSGTSSSESNGHLAPPWIYSANANIILYRHIMLNTMVSFQEVERVARSGFSACPSPTTSLKPTIMSKCPYHLESTREIYVYCGQVLRVIRHTRAEATSLVGGRVYTG